MTNHNPERLIETAATGAVVRILARVNRRRVELCLAELFVGQDPSQPSFYRLAATIDPARIGNETVTKLTSYHISSLPSSSAELTSYFADWLAATPKMQAGWQSDQPVVFTMNQDGAVESCPLSHPLFLWVLMIIQQRIASGLGPNTLLSSSLVFDRLSRLILDIQNAALEPLELRL